jgi:sugar lactone lactonase YvrE
MALGKDGVVFVANRTPHITKFTVDQEFIQEFGRTGEFTFLSGIGLDKDQNIYASDEWRNRITVFDNDCNVMRTWGEEGDGPGQLNGVTGLTFDADDNVWLVNSLNSRIQKFSKDGKYISGFGVKGNGPGELDMPWGMTLDNNGDVYVADWNNHRVQKFSPDGSHLLTFGSGKITGVATDGSTPYKHALVHDIDAPPTDLNHPAGVAVDGDGDVYIADWMNERIVIFDKEATALTTLRGDAHEISKWGAMTLDASPDMRRRHRLAKNPDVRQYFRMPTYCAFDQETDRLMVCDTMRGRIQIYQKEEGYKDPQFNL